MQTGTFGPRVIGAKRFKKEQKEREESRHIFGERVLGPRITEDSEGGEAKQGKDLKVPRTPSSDDLKARNDALGAATVDVTELTITELAAHVKDHPGEAEALLQREQKRDGGPRKGAVEVLEATIEQHQEPETPPADTGDGEGGEANGDGGAEEGGEGGEDEEEEDEEE